MKQPQISRRDWLRYGGLGMLSLGASPWLGQLSAAAAAGGKRRHCVVLWMAGGPTQTDTFDMKPGHDNGGEFKAISTSVPGIKISEHLPKLASQMEHLAIVRSLSTKEGDHGRGTFLMRTGKQPGGPVRFPAFPSSLAKELGSDLDELPAYVSVGGNNLFNPSAFGPGFLGPQYAATTVGVRGAAPDQTPNAEAAPAANLGVDYLTPQAGVDSLQVRRRLDLWRAMQDEYVSSRPAGTVVAQDTIYRRAVRMMQSKAKAAFDLTQESEKVRESYGPSVFGQGCLLARRLIEQGVSVVEVALNGWDTHADNFNQVRNLSEQLDNGWGTLMQELSDRGLLESTTFVWMGEFGRTPVINDNTGRDHFPQAWSCVLGGGGIQGGQAYGKTSEDGQEVVDKKTDETHVLATLCSAVGVDPAKENMTRLGRPIKIIEGEPIQELLREQQLAANVPSDATDVSGE